MKFSSIFIIIIVAILSYSLTSCSNTPNELKIAEQVMKVHPDSALHILQKLHPQKYSSAANRALYGLLLFQTLDKCNMSLQPDSLIDFSIKYYIKQDDKNRLVTCHLYKGRTYLNKNKYEQAASEYVKALGNSNEETDYRILGKIYSDMGAICSFQRQYYEARKKYQLAANYFSKAKKKEAIYSSILNIGVTYRCTKKFKVALKYCFKVISQTNDSILLGVAYQEIGNIYMISNQPDSAIHYLRKSLSYPAKKTDCAIRNYLLANTYVDKNMNDSAEVYTRESLKYPADFITRRDCYKILANNTSLKGHIKLAGKYISRYQDYNDSIRIVESQTKATVIEDLYKNSAETNGTKHWLIIVISFLIIIVLLGGLISYYLYNSSKQKKIELESFKTELNNKQMFVSQSISNKIKDSKSIQAAARKNAVPSEKDKLDTEIYNSSIHINDWTIFTYEMNHAFNNIVDKLQSKYPILSRKEISWCCLQLLSIPSADKILLLKTTTEGLYKMKQRIALKLELKSTKDLDEFLKDIVSKQI